ncbi:MAG: phosphoglycolate phosphatase [Alteromonas macleodii]|jgi:phosphoglycolate phosphatase
MISRPIKGIIFDKDGTLFDFNATWGAWARNVFEVETAGDPDQLASLAAALKYDLAAGQFLPESLVIASTVYEIAQAVLPFVAETDASALIERFNAAAMCAPQVETTSLVAFITKLKSAGLKVGVATNDAEYPARAHLRVAGIEALFDFIAGFDSGFGGKPAPGQLLGFCNSTGLSPSECVMVGDSTHDLHAGRAAGMVTVAVLTGVAARAELAPNAEVVLNSIAELPKWLKL